MTESANSKIKSSVLIKQYVRNINIFLLFDACIFLIANF